MNKLLDFTKLLRANQSRTPQNALGAGHGTLVNQERGKYGSLNRPNSVRPQQTV